MKDKKYEVYISLPFKYYIRAKNKKEANKAAHRMAQDEVDTGVVGSDLEFITEYIREYIR